VAFPNARKILKMGHPLSSYKLLLVAASCSRPRFRGLCLELLRPFIRNGEVALRYRCYDRSMRMFLRMSEMSSDLLGALELGTDDTYNLDLDIGPGRAFRPDLVIDGGGNIGLFTLRAAAATASAGAAQVEFVVCEPLPRNADQIQRHLDLNNVQAELMRVCLGGSRRSVPFYCREAIDSSFDPEKPYLSVMEMPVYTLEDAIGSGPAERILIKLDIEGMEIEVLNAFVPSEKRAVYVVGELHEFARNAPLLERIFEENGWPFEYRSISHDHALFRACSPSALPLLSSMQGIQSPVRAAGVSAA